MPIPSHPLSAAIGTATALLSPPRLGVPQVTTAPSALIAAKAKGEPTISCSSWVRLILHQNTRFIGDLHEMYPLHASTILHPGPVHWNLRKASCKLLRGMDPCFHHVSVRCPNYLQNNGTNIVALNFPVLWLIFAAHMPNNFILNGDISYHCLVFLCVSCLGMFGSPFILKFVWQGRHPLRSYACVLQLVYIGFKNRCLAIRLRGPLHPPVPTALRCCCLLPKVGGSPPFSLQENTGIPADTIGIPGWRGLMQHVATNICIGTFLTSLEGVWSASTFLPNENDEAQFRCCFPWKLGRWPLWAPRPRYAKPHVTTEPSERMAAEGLNSFFWRVGDFPVIWCHLIGGWATHSRHVPSGYLT